MDGIVDCKEFSIEAHYRQGLFTMTGSAITRFERGSAIGKCPAEWVTEGKARTVDLTPFRATRFAEGMP